ncbi:MAG: aminoacyl--tRNA ligase-related protein [Patescibacteria group bacterium]
MRQSFLFTKTVKNVPRDEVSINSTLLIKAGFIEKLAAGIYSYLPLGLRSLNKIENIVREEMNAAGGQEILMPALTPKKNWEQTDRWEHFDALFKLKGANDKDYALGATHEEIVVPIAQKFIFSYKDLPKYIYQIQTKFRNEPRAKSGLLRGREFLMKDLYSFHTNQEDLDKYYEVMMKAYTNIFEKCGLGSQTHVTLASGGTFSKYSHEYQTICETGEDTIHICKKCNLGINNEIKDETPKCPECGSTEFQKQKAIEVGNIFKLKSKYSQPFNFNFIDQDDKEHPVLMGCYGIGPSRVLGTIVEVHNDQNGIIWPENIAPYKFHLIDLSKNSARADEVYGALQKKEIEVLYDDRNESAGAKLKDSDLIGIPYRLVISEKTGDKIELKQRSTEETKLVTLEEVLNV